MVVITSISNVNQTKIQHKIFIKYYNIVFRLMVDLGMTIKKNFKTKKILFIYIPIYLLFII